MLLRDLWVVYLKRVDGEMDRSKAPNRSGRAESGGVWWVRWLVGACFVFLNVKRVFPLGKISFGTFISC